MSRTFNRQIFDEIRESQKKWLKELAKIFESNPERLERFSTVSDQEIENIYDECTATKGQFNKAISGTKNILNIFYC